MMSTGMTTSALDWGVASRPLPGQTASGDIHVVQPVDGGVLVGVVDALGHGEDAAVAARLAAETLCRHAAEPIPALIERCHRALMGTRGIVMSVAFFDVAHRTMTWLGVGDVEGVLVLADPGSVPSRTGLASRGGIVGANLPPARPWVIPVSAGDTLIFTTDGIRGESTIGPALQGTAQQIANLILSRGFKGTDDGLVLVARVRDDAGGART